MNISTSGAIEHAMLHEQDFVPETEGSCDTSSTPPSEPPTENPPTPEPPTEPPAPEPPTEPVSGTLQLCHQRWNGSYKLLTLRVPQAAAHTDFHDGDYVTETGECDGNQNPAPEPPTEPPGTPTPVSIVISGLTAGTVVTYRTDLRAVATFSDGSTQVNPYGIEWSVSPASLVSFLDEDSFRAIDDGNMQISANFNGLSDSKSLDIQVSEEVAVPTVLRRPMANRIKRVNVLVVSFLPTVDGVNIDIAQTPDFGDLGEISISGMQQRILDFNTAGKFMLEEGSRFRGYSDSSAPPYLGYQIRKHLTVYEQIPSDTRYPVGTDNGTTYYQPHYTEVFERFGLTSYIEEQDIHEVWLWYGEPTSPGRPSYTASLHAGITNHVGFVESNMSSPTTGDVSNSYRHQNDLPILDHTYVVYGYNFRRTQNEMVHNHGHQLEAMFKHVATEQDGNDDLFVSDFSGWGPAYSAPPLGRSGDTHHPPNTTRDYDYTNTALVESDIEDWTPDGSGTTRMVNNQTWAGIPYDWPAYMYAGTLDEPAWYIYWMQNMPGYLNRIPYDNQGRIMSNWWEFRADWDTAFETGVGLHD